MVNAPSRKARHRSLRHGISHAGRRLPHASPLNIAIAVGAVLLGVIPAVSTGNPFTGSTQLGASSVPEQDSVAAPSSVAPSAAASASAQGLQSRSELESKSASASGPVSITDFGAICDGQHDDGDALVQALTAIAKRKTRVLVVPGGTCRIVATRSRPSIGLPSGLILQGLSSRSTLALDCDDESGFRQLFQVQQSRIQIKGLSIVRQAPCNGVLLKIEAGSYFSLSRVVIDGRSQEFAGGMHAIQFGDSPNSISHLSIDRSSIKNSVYGLFQTSASRLKVSDVTVSNSTFSGNSADDLEFNAPTGKMNDVKLQNNSFSNGGGFAVGLANVQQVKIGGNRFSNYGHEMIHIEDRSADVAIVKNNFSKPLPNSVPSASFVFIINGSRNVQVVNNVFRSTTNKSLPQCIYSGPGGSYPYPRGLIVRGNAFYVAGATIPWTVYGGAGFRNSGNALTKSK